MSQMPVKWTAESFLKEQRTTLHRIPVVPLSALREVVEDLKRIQVLAKQNHTAPLDPFGDLIRIEDVTQRLLAHLDAEGVR